MKKQSLAILARRHLHLSSEKSRVEKELKTVNAAIEKRLGKRTAILAEAPDGEAFMVDRLYQGREQMLSKEQAIAKKGRGFLELHKLLKKVSWLQLRVKKVK